MARTAEANAKRNPPSTGIPDLDEKIQALIKSEVAAAEKHIRADFERDMERDVEDKVKSRLKKLGLDEDAIKKAGEAGSKLSEAEKAQKTAAEKAADAEKKAKEAADKAAEAEKKLKEAIDKLAEADKRSAAADEKLAEAKKLFEELKAKLDAAPAAVPATSASASDDDAGGDVIGRLLPTMNDDQRKRFTALVDELDAAEEVATKARRFFR